MGSVSRRGPRRVGGAVAVVGRTPAPGGTPDGAEGPAAALARSVGGDAEHRLDPREVEEERGRGVRPRGSSVDGACASRLLAASASSFSLPSASERMTCSVVSNTASASGRGTARPSLVAAARDSSGVTRPSVEEAAKARVSTSTGRWCRPRRARAAARNAPATCSAVFARCISRISRDADAGEVARGGGHVPSRGRPRATRRSMCPKRKRPHQRLLRR